MDPARRTERSPLGGDPPNPINPPRLPLPRPLPAAHAGVRGAGAAMLLSVPGRRTRRLPYE
jgi:hypothetical protein